MPREKPGYRDMLELLMKDYPPTMSKTLASNALGVSRTHLDKIIGKGKIKVSDGKIAIGQIASYLCG